MGVSLSKIIVGRMRSALLLPSYVAICVIFCTGPESECMEKCTVFVFRGIRFETHAMDRSPKVDYFSVTGPHLYQHRVLSACAGYITSQ